MSEQVQSIVESVRALTDAQQRELFTALTALRISRSASPKSRKRVVESVRGKYSHVPTSSESFLRRKRNDTNRESRP